MDRTKDNILQIVFVGALVAVALLFYFTRIAGLKAGDQVSSPTVLKYETFAGVYQFEQEERKIQTRIEMLKAEYASDLIVFQSERRQIEKLKDLSDLEKREKQEILKQIYSDQYFQRKIDLIEEQLLELDSLRQAKCRKFCVYQDLPG